MFKFTRKEKKGGGGPTTLISPSLASLSYHHNFLSILLHVLMSCTFFSYIKSSNLLKFRIMKHSTLVKYIVSCIYLQNSGRTKDEEIVKSYCVTLAGLVRWLECQPMDLKAKGMYLSCRVESWPQLGVCRRQSIIDSLTHH